MVRLYVKIMVLLAVQALILPTISFAEEGFVCAEVIPDCDANNEPLPPFNDKQSPCYSKYFASCQRKKVSQACSVCVDAGLDLATKLKQCEIDKELLAKKLNAKKKK